MFCPKCKAEYEKEIKECADCKVWLVPKLMPEPLAEPTPENVKYKAVLSTFNQMDIAMIKSVLEPEGIKYYFIGEYCNYVPPLALPVVLMIQDDRVDDANDLLKSLNLKFNLFVADDNETQNQS